MQSTGETRRQPWDEGAGDHASADEHVDEVGQYERLVVGAGLTGGAEFGAEDHQPHQARNAAEEDGADEDQAGRDYLASSGRC